MPRPTVYTRAIGRAICQRVAAGMPITLACRQEGIGRRTLYDWRAAGRRGRAPYAAFAAELDRAEARAEAAITLRIVQAARRDWRAGAWYLERRWPKRWALRTRLEARPQPNVERMTDADLDAALERLGYVRRDRLAELGYVRDVQH
jgi:hypothetical protein